MSTVINHYGKYIDSDIPSTGVLSNNSVCWEFMTDEICLTCEEIQDEIESDDSMDEEQKEHELEFIECDSDHTRLYGDWIKDTNGQYAPDESGEFAAIGRETELQVVWSKYTTRGNVCSPCFAGQIDLDSKGKFLAYTLPDYLLR